MKRLQHAIPKLCVILFLLIGVAGAQSNPLNPITNFARQADGVQFTSKSGILKLQVCSESIIRVLYARGPTFPKTQDFVVIKTTWPSVKWDVQSDSDAITLTTSQLKIKVTRKDASIDFTDAAGKKLFQQTEITMTPSVVNGEKTYLSELYSKLWAF